MDYELISYSPVLPQEITAETYVRLSAYNQRQYRPKVANHVPHPDREEKAYYPFTDDANRTDDPQAPYKQKNSEL